MKKCWLVILLVLFSDDLLACKCEAAMIGATEKKAEYIIAAASNVFLAKVTKSTPIGKSKNDITATHNFEIIESYKGNPTSLSYLKTGSENPASCDDDGMIEGGYYLVFTDSTDVSDCSVMEVDLEQEYYKELFEHLSKLRTNQQNQALKEDADSNSAF